MRKESYSLIPVKAETIATMKRNRARFPVELRSLSLGQYIDHIVATHTQVLDKIESTKEQS